MKRDRKPSRVENEDDAFVLPPSSEQNLKKDVDGIAPGTLQGLDKAFRVTPKNIPAYCKLAFFLSSLDNFKIEREINICNRTN